MKLSFAKEVIGFPTHEEALTADAILILATAVVLCRGACLSCLNSVVCASLIEN